MNEPTETLTMDQVGRIGELVAETVLLREALRAIVLNQGDHDKNVAWGRRLLYALDDVRAELPAAPDPEDAP